jgi:hypothetical protein
MKEFQKHIKSLMAHSHMQLQGRGHATWWEFKISLLVSDEAEVV